MPSSTRTRPSVAAALLAIALAPLCAGQATAADDLAPLRVAQADDAYRPGGTAYATTPIGRMTPPGMARSTPGDRQAG